MSIPLSEALKFWAKLGFVSFGGPAGQIAVLHQELVEKRRWISERRFLHALNYCMVLPGPEAQQLVTYIGWLMHRSWGGILAGTLFVLPSLLILIALSWVYLTYGQVPWIAAIFFGIKPAVTAIVLHAAIRIGKRTIHNQALQWIALGSFLAIFILNLSFPIIVLIAAAIGYWGGKRYPEYFQQVGHGSKAVNSDGGALIDDDTPTPAHAQFNYQKTLFHSAIAFTCWLLPIGALIAIFGWKTLYPNIAWFFTKAAFLTFGGAYAVLPYVYQGAVDQFHWLSANQMIDGLALGETTPGPLNKVVAFVGYLAGHIQPLLVWHTRCCCGHLVYFFAILLFYLGWRSIGGINAWQDWIYCATDCNHCSSSWRHRQSGSVFCLSCVFTSWLRWLDFLDLHHHLWLSGISLIEVPKRRYDGSWWLRPSRTTDLLCRNVDHLSYFPRLA